MGKNLSFRSSRKAATQIIKNIRGKVAQNLVPTYREHIALRDKATAGWSDRNKPTVTIEPIEGAGLFGFRVKIEAEEAEGAGVTVYELLNEGTNVRRAKMGDLFSPKTRPRSFGRFGAGGRPIAIKASYEFPGIEAREWEETIIKLLEKPMEVRIDRGIRQGFLAQ